MLISIRRVCRRRNRILAIARVATLIGLGAGLIVGATVSTASAAVPAGYVASPNWAVGNTTATTTLPGNAAAFGNVVATNDNAPAQSMIPGTGGYSLDGVNVPRVLPANPALSTACLAGKPVGQQTTCATYRTTVTLPHPVVDPIIPLSMGGGGSSAATWCTAGWNNIAFSSVNGASPAAGVVTPQGGTGNFVFAANALTLPQSYIAANTCSAPSSGSGAVYVQLKGLISSFSLDNAWMVEVTKNTSNSVVSGYAIGGTVFNVDVPSADLSITKTAPATVAPNGTIAWTINLTNNGPSASHGFVIHDAIPANVTGATLASAPAGCALTGNDLVCSQAPPGCTTTQNPTLTTWADLSCSPSTAADATVLGAGASFGPITFTGNAPSTAGSVVTNIATVSGADSDPNTANNTGTTTTTVNTAACLPASETQPGTADCAQAQRSAPQVIVTKAVNPASGSPANVGQDLAYTLTFKNTGTKTAHVDRVDDLRGILDDATLTEAPAVSDPAWNVGLLQGGTLPIKGELEPGRTVTIQYAATVRPDGKRGDNMLVSTLLPQGTPQDSAQDKTCPPQAEACVENPVSSWSVTLTADKAAAAPGDTVSYTAKQTNTGAVAIQTGAQTSIDLGGTLDDAHYTGDAPAAVDYASPRLSWSTALAVGEQRTITYTVTVKLSAGGNHRLRSVIDGGSNCQPGSPAPECSTETTISAAAVAAAGGGDASVTGSHGLPAITTAAAKTPNWALFAGGLAALTAGLLGNLSRFRGSRRRHRNPSRYATEL